MVYMCVFVRVLALEYLPLCVCVNVRARVLCACMSVRVCVCVCVYSGQTIAVHECWALRLKIGLFLQSVRHFLHNVGLFRRNLGPFW